jgi:hypothetical protein
MFTKAVPIFVASCTDVAPTVACPVTFDAWYKPDESIVPVPETTDHVTEGSKLPAPWTRAEHWEVSLMSMTEGLQETATDVMVGGAATMMVAEPLAVPIAPAQARR